MKNKSEKYSYNRIPMIALLIFGVLLISLTGQIPAEFVRINTRFGLFVAEINQYGPGLFPTLYGKPYTDYPSTVILMMWLASLGGRYINMFTTVLPTAVAAVIALFFTWRLGERAAPRLGIFGAVLCLLSFEFINLARNPGLDMWLAAITVIAVYLIYTSLLGDGVRRLAWLPVLLLAGYAIRGPLGVVIPSGAIIGCYLSARRWNLVFLWTFICGMTGLVALLLWLLLCYHVGGRELLELFVYDQVLGRMGGGTQHPAYYFTNAAGSYALTYPLALLVMAVYFGKIFRKPSPEDSRELVFLRLLAFWILVITLGMSIPGTKHLRYIVAAVPPMGLMSAWIFMNFDRLKLFAVIRRYFLLVCRWLPLAGLAAAIAAAVVLGIAGVEWTPPLAKIIAVMTILTFGSFCLRRNRKEKIDLELLAVAVACMAAVKVLLVDPIEQHRESAKEFSLRLESLRGDNQVWYYDFGPDTDELKYLVNIPWERRFAGKYIAPPSAAAVKTSASASAPAAREGIRDRIWRGILSWLPDDPPGRYAPVRPMFEFEPADNYEAIFRAPAGTLFITRENRFGAIPERYRDRLEVLMSGRCGRRVSVVFRVAPSP